MSNTEKAIEFGLSLIGTPYGYWKGGVNQVTAPMFADNNPLPPKNQITCLNCAGLVNLMLKSIGKKIPYNGEGSMGGTESYGEYYLYKSTTFNINKNYPIGTLLIRDYKDLNDQGHVAVIIEDKGKNSLILQSHVDGEYFKDTYPGVNTMYTLEESEGDGYYEFAVLPEDWLE